MTYTLPDLDYDYNALEPSICAEIMELHHSKHHAAYVAGANQTMEKLAEARAKNDFGAIVGLEKTLAFNVSGHVNHSMFWKNLSPNGGGEPTGDLATQITKDFGSFAAFKAHMTNVATTIQGSGWAMLTLEPLGQTLSIAQVYDQQNNSFLGAHQVFGIDMWEHAFYLQYKNVKADYVTKLWDVVNWDDVSARLKAAQASTLVGV